MTREHFGTDRGDVFQMGLFQANGEVSCPAESARHKAVICRKESAAKSYKTCEECGAAERGKPRLEWRQARWPRWVKRAEGGFSLAKGGVGEDDAEGSCN